MVKKKSIISWIAYAAALVGFTTYVMLDTFVLPRVIDSDADKMNMSLFESQAPTESAQLSTENGTTAVTETLSTESSYKDENISIELTEYNAHDTAIYVADVQLSSAQYLKTAFANDSYGRNIKDKTSSIAEDKNAVFAVNGDFYGARESGYVIRNGILYRSSGDSSADVLCIYADGSFAITNSKEKDAQELVDEGVWQAFSFGPALVEDGSVSVSEKDEVGKAMASNPRTAIGIIDELHYVFVVSDGRTSESEGLSLFELAQFMEGLGVKTAYNLDGGGSSSMYFNGKVINKPTTNGRSIKERSVSDIVYIGY
jgi:exopolysaccharide biosynthesis protein